MGMDWLPSFLMPALPVPRAALRAITAQEECVLLVLPTRTLLQQERRRYPRVYCVPLVHHLFLGLLLA